MSGSKVIGIVSYLPDNLLRLDRIRLLDKTLTFFSSNLPLIPIIVIALNWKDYKPLVPCTVYSYENGLGVLKARMLLIKVFLESDYDTIIMSDDDISATIDNTYLQQIDDNPGKVGLVETTTSLILVSFPKEVLRQIPIPYRDPYDYYEDLYIISVVKENFDYFFFKGITDNTLRENGKFSTWWSKQVCDHKKFKAITLYLISNYKEVSSQ